MGSAEFSVNFLDDQSIQRFLRKTKAGHPLSPYLSWDYWDAFGNWFVQNRKLGRVPTRRWPESKLLDNFMSEHFRLLHLWASLESGGEVTVDVTDYFHKQEDMYSNLAVGALYVDQMLNQEMKYLKASQQKVAEFIETDGLVPRRFLRNLGFPFESFFIEFDKPWVYEHWTQAVGDQKQPFPARIWGIKVTNISNSEAFLRTIKRGTNKGPWVMLQPIFTGNINTYRTSGSIVEKLSYGSLFHNVDYTPRSLWYDEDEDYWAEFLEREDIEHSDNAFRVLSNCMTDFDYLVLSLDDGSIFVGDDNYGTADGISINIGTIYDLDNLRLDRKLMETHGNYQQAVRNWGEFARMFSATLMYMMSKSIRFTNSRPLTRAEKHRGEKYPPSWPKGTLPIPWIDIEVETIEDDEGKIATGAGTPHSFRYDVIGHTRIYRKKQADGSIRRVPVWVKGHQRGIRHEDYVPKRHTFTTEHTVPSEIKQLVIEQV